MECTKYIPSLYDLIIMPYHIIFKLCLSTDKTKLILMSMARIIVLLFVFNLFKQFDLIQTNQENIIKFTICLGFLIYIFFNMVYIVVAFLKQPVMSKDQEEQILQNLSKQLHEYKFTTLS